MNQEESTIAEVLEPELNSESNAAPTVTPGEIIIGTLVELDEQGQPWVDFPENPTNKNFLALTTQHLTKKHIGRQVALLFANGNIKTPVIMGVIHSPLQDMLESFEQQPSSDIEVFENVIQNKNENKNIQLESNLNVDNVLIDGKKITFEAREQIVLKCGESSITLTKAGEILIRGKYLLNRSTGVNRIMGGSVQVN